MAFDKVVDSKKLDDALTATADAIRAKSGSAAPIVFDETQGFKASVENIGADGGIDNQWWLDWFKTQTNISYYFNYSSGITRLPKGIDFSNVDTMNYLFYGNHNINELPYINSSNAISCSQFLADAGGEITEVTIEIPKIENLNGFCNQNRSIKIINFIGDGSHITKSFSMLYDSFVEEIYCYSDKTMTEEVFLDFSGNLSTNTFTGATQIRYVRFRPNCLLISMDFQACQYLTDQTVQNIIEALADLTGQDTQTLTLHPDVKSKLTDEQKAQITAKNWTLA